MEDGRGDVVGKVSENKGLRDAFLPAQCGKIGAQHIGVDDLHVGLAAKIFLKTLRERLIDFDGDDLARVLGKQSSHGPAPRADFNHHIAGRERKRLQNSGLIPLVVEKMLAQFGAMTADFGFSILDFGFTSPLCAS